MPESLPTNLVVGSAGHVGDHNELHGFVESHPGVATGVHGVGASTVESVAGANAKVSAHDALATAHTGTFVRGTVADLAPSAPAVSTLWHKPGTLDLKAAIATNTAVLMAGGAAVNDHIAFPGMVRAANGDLVVVVRRGQTETDLGDLELYRSTNGGVTWLAPVLIRNAADDWRDAALTLLANGNIMCSFTKTTNGSNDYKPYVITSTDHGATWGTEVLVAHGFSEWAYCSAPVVQLPNGHLLLPLYGNDTGGAQVNWYSRVSRSTDGGATWANYSTLVPKDTLSRHWVEPNIARDPATGLLVAMIRTSANVIYSAHSSNDGLTWSPPVSRFAGSGRPGIFYSSVGAFIVPYRESGTSATSVRASWDGGTTWGTPLVMPESSALMAYAALADMADGTVGMAWFVEVNSGRGDGYFSKLTPTVPTSRTWNGTNWVPADVASAGRADQVSKSVAQVILGAKTFAGSAVSDIPVTIDAVAGQEANLLNLSVAGVIKASFNSVGNLTVPNISTPAIGATLVQAGGSAEVGFAIASRGQNFFKAAVDSNVVLAIRGASATQSGALTSWQTHDGTVVATMSVAGLLRILGGGSVVSPVVAIGGTTQTLPLSVLGRSFLQSNADGTVAVTIRSFSATATANPLSVESWNGTVLSAVTVGGVLSATFPSGRKDLVEGAADSGGTGFRMVRIAN